MTSTESAPVSVPAPISQLDVARGKQIVTLAISELKKPENIDVLKKILDECQREQNPMMQFQLKMQKLIPKVMEILGAQVSAVIGDPVDSSQVMAYVMQIQTLAMTDVHLGVEVSKIMKTLSGDFSGLDEQDDDPTDEIEEIE